MEKKEAKPEYTEVSFWNSLPLIVTVKFQTEATVKIQLKHRQIRRVKLPANIFLT